MLGGRPRQLSGRACLVTQGAQCLATVGVQQCLTCAHVLRYHLQAYEENGTTFLVGSQGLVPVNSRIRLIHRVTTHSLKGSCGRGRRPGAARAGVPGVLLQPQRVLQRLRRQGAGHAAHRRRRARDHRGAPQRAQERCGCVHGPAGARVAAHAAAERTLTLET